ncbi:MAG TPA: DUF305 domain-containing protein [Jiangellales bacterium]|nr:DUF305 domain-containing protein [Jiangellales bacterium]
MRSFVVRLASSPNGSTTVRRALLAGATVVITLALATACGASIGTDEQPQSPTGPTAATFNDADVAFAQMMIPHHEQAAEMATLAQDKATDPELLEIAAAIRSAQEPEIATLSGWLQSWGKPTTMPSSGGHGHDMSGMGGGTGMPGMMSEQEMADLQQTTGVDFDRMFTRMMMAHHNGAIQMCHDIAESGANPDVKALAATIEQAQSAEVAQLQTILDRL